MASETYVTNTILQERDSGRRRRDVFDMSSQDSEDRYLAPRKRKAPTSSEPPLKKRSKTSGSGRSALMEIALSKDERDKQSGKHAATKAIARHPRKRKSDVITQLRKRLVEWLEDHADPEEPFNRIRLDLGQYFDQTEDEGRGILSPEFQDIFWQHMLQKCIVTAAGDAYKEAKGEYGLSDKRVQALVEDRKGGARWTKKSGPNLTARDYKEVLDLAKALGEEQMLNSHKHCMTAMRGSMKMEDIVHFPDPRNRAVASYKTGFEWLYQCTVEKGKILRLDEYTGTKSAQDICDMLTANMQSFTSDQQLSIAKTAFRSFLLPPDHLSALQRSKLRDKWKKELVRPAIAQQLAMTQLQPSESSSSVDQLTPEQARLLRSKQDDILKNTQAVDAVYFSQQQDPDKRFEYDSAFDEYASKWLFRQRDRVGKELNSSLMRIGSTLNDVLKDTSTSERSAQVIIRLASEPLPTPEDEEQLQYSMTEINDDEGNPEPHFDASPTSLLSHDQDGDSPSHDLVGHKLQTMTTIESGTEIGGGTVLDIAEHTELMNCLGV